MRGEETGLGDAARGALATTVEASGPVETEILAIVRDVGREFHLPEDRLAPLSTGTSFDRDLGLDSLTRVEVIARVERHCNVVLPERAFRELETIGDLVHAVARAPSGGPAAVQRQAEGAPATAAVVSIPARAETVVDVLDWHVARHGARTHLILCEESSRESPLTYLQLRDGAAAAARGLTEHGVGKGDAVAIMLPTSHDYFFCFLGILLVGATPVPIYPPTRPNQIEDHLHRHSSILNNCRAKVLITTTSAKTVARLLRLRVSSLKTIVSASELARTPATSAGAPSLAASSIEAGDLAFLQYTSGSTGNPKGVMLTHANLLANIRAMGDAIKASPADVFVSWLPLYHDMGLVGAWLGSLYFAMRLVVMSPFAFLGHPDRWLRALERYKGTITAAPNFAYELCLKRINDDEIAGLDLKSVRVMCNGAEAVAPETVRRFAARFARCALRETAIMPVYGLAENAVGLAFPPLSRAPRIDTIDRETFVRERRAVPAVPAVPAAMGARLLQFVGCGQPVTGHEIRIVDGAGRELPERREGRVQFRGPSATKGYLNNPEETARLLQGSWLNSGDLAYLAEGDIFITGRIKDVVKHAGRSIYPDELEAVIGGLDGVRKGCVAVFGSASVASGTERLIVLAETRETAPSRLTAIRAQVNAAVADVIGAAPDDVVLAPPHTVLKTSSGKIRRSASRALYEAGKIVMPGSRSATGPSVRWQVARFTLGAIPGQIRRMRVAAVETAQACWAWVCAGATAILAWPIVVLWPSLSGRWRFVREVARILGWAAGIKVNVLGRENIPPQPLPCILVANHASYIDVVALAIALPRVVTFTAKAELGKSSLLRLPLSRLDVDFVERFDVEKGVADVRRVAAAGQAGKSLLFFPEGTFTRRPGLLPFHMGAFLAAVETGLPLVPVAIRGTRSILHDESWVIRRGEVTVRFLPPVNVDLPPGATDWEKAVALRDAARREILRYNGEADLGQERPFP